MTQVFTPQWIRFVICCVHDHGDELIVWSLDETKLLKLPCKLFFCCFSVHTTTRCFAPSHLDFEQRQKLERFSSNYESGVDVGMPHHVSNACAKQNPKMDMRSRSKIPQTILKWYHEKCFSDLCPRSHAIAKECRIKLVFWF